MFKKILSMLLIASTLSLSLVATNPQVSHADLAACKYGSDSTACSSDSDAIGSIGSAITTVMLFLSGAVAVICIIYAGILYTTSGGDSKRIEKAKKMLIYSIVGIAVAVVSYAVVTFVIERVFTTT